MNGQPKGARRYAQITGWGMAVPEKVLTNDDLARVVDTTDEWIVRHTGIRQRHVAGEETTSIWRCAAAVVGADGRRRRPHRSAW